MIIKSKVLTKLVPGLKPQTPPPIIFNFSHQQQANIKTRAFKNNAINDFTKIAFEPKQRLQFINGKCLIYKNSRSVFRVLYEAMHYWIPITGISYLIYLNPFAAYFPAALPILAILDFVVFKLWLNRIKWNQNLVSEIYLFQNGEASEVWFANKNKRKMFGQQLYQIYYNSLFVNPDYKTQQVLLFNKARRIFPISLKDASERSTGYAWVKHFSNGQNLLVIPKKADFMNLEIMIELFKGKIIKSKIKN